MVCFAKVNALKKWGITHDAAPLLDRYQQLLQQGSLVDENLSADVAYRGASLDPVVKPRDDFARVGMTLLRSGWLCQDNVIPRLDRGIQKSLAPTLTYKYGLVFLTELARMLTSNH